METQNCETRQRKKCQRLKKNKGFIWNSQLRSYFIFVDAMEVRYEVRRMNQFHIELKKKLMNADVDGDLDVGGR